MRTKRGHARRKAKRRLFQKVEGFVGGRRRLLRTAKETLIRSGVSAFRDRRLRRRNMRRLWIVRLSAACRMRGLRYSELIMALKKAHIELDRKSLSEMAIRDPAGFDVVIGLVREHLPEAAAAT
jgi:large subunit ribosomal protein L20